MSGRKLPTVTPRPRHDTLDRLLEVAGIGTFRYTLDGIVVYMDAGALRILEIDGMFDDPAEVRGMALGDLFTYVIPSSTLRQQVVDNGHIHNFEYPFQTLAGRLKWAMHDAYLMVDTKTNEPMVQTVARDITQLKRVEQQLQESNRKQEQTNLELEKTNREQAAVDELRNNLLANVSHDLRSPLVAVRGYAELIHDGVSGPVNDQQRRQLSVIIRNVSRVARLIEDLLDFSRLQSGDVRLEPRACGLNRSAELAVTDSRPNADEKGLTLLFSPYRRELVVNADEQRLAQVITNLLENAIKFTPPGGRVEVRTWHGPGGLAALSVIDTGPGIPEDKLEMIFERFYQADPSSTRKHGGLGLGLATCRNLVEAMGGTIRAEPSGGHGARLSFFLPLDETDICGDGPHRPMPPLMPAKHADTEDNGWLLVVDDDPQIGEFLVRILEHYSVRAEVVTGGAAALELLEHRRPKAVLLDLAMPDLNGVDVCRSIRRDPNLHDLPVVMITAATEIEDTARRAGVNAFLKKPFGIKQLMKVLRDDIGAIAKTETSPKSGTAASRPRTPPSRSRSAPRSNR